MTARPLFLIGSLALATSSTWGRDVELTPEPSRLWLLREHGEMSQDVNEAVKWPLSDDAAAICAGILCREARHEEDPVLRRLTEQTEKSDTVSARNVEFLAINLAQGGDVPAARRIMAKHAGRFPDNCRFAFAHLAVDSVPDGRRTGNGPPPRMPHRKVAERLLQIFDKNAAAKNPVEEPVDRDGTIDWELQAWRGALTADEIALQWFPSPEPRDINIEEVLTGGREDDLGRYPDSFLPHSPETCRLLTLSWLADLAEKVGEADAPWLKKELKRRLKKLDWEFLRHHDLANRAYFKQWETYHEESRLVWAVAQRGLPIRDTFPDVVKLLRAAFGHFEKSRPQLAVVAGLRLAESKTPQDHDYVDRALKLAATLPEWCGEVNSQLSFIASRHDSEDKPFGAEEWKRWEPAIRSLLMTSRKRGQLHSQWFETLGELLAEAKEWPELFALWHEWLTIAPPAENVWPYQRDPIPWLDFQSKEPGWLEWQMKAAWRSLPLGGIEPGGEAAEAAFVAKAREIPGPWLRLRVLAGVSPAAAQEEIKRLTNLPAPDFQTCLTLADHFVGAAAALTWLDRAAELSNLTNEERQAIDGRRIIWLAWDPILRSSDQEAPAAVREALDRMQQRRLSASQARRLEGAAQCWRNDPPRKFRAADNLLEMERYVGHGVLDREPRPIPEATPEYLRIKLREVLLRTNQKLLEDYEFGDAVPDPRAPPVLMVHLKTMAERSEERQLAVALALWRLRRRDDALSQMQKVIAANPGEARLRREAFSMALRLNDEAAIRAAEMLAAEDRTEAFFQALRGHSSVATAILQLMPAMERRATACRALEGNGEAVLPLVAEEVATWKDLTAKEAARLAWSIRFASSKPAQAQVAADKVLTHLLESPAGCREAWNHIMAGKEGAEPTVNLASRVILTDVGAGLDAITDPEAWRMRPAEEPAKVFLTDARNRNDPAAVAEICRKLEAKNSPHAAVWRLREVIHFGAPRAAAEALEKFAGDPAVPSALLKREVRHAVEVFGQRQFTAVKLATARRKLWDAFRQSRDPEDAVLQCQIHSIDADESALFVLFQNDAPQFLMPPNWSRDGIRHIDPLALTDLTHWPHLDPADAAGRDWTRGWMAFQTIARTLIIEPKWTWQTLAAWRKAVFPLHNPRETTLWDATGELVSDFFWPAISQMMAEDPGATARFLREMPMFAGDHIDFTPELSKLADIHGSALEPEPKTRIPRTVAGTLLGLVRDLPEKDRKFLTGRLFSDQEPDRFYQFLLRAALDHASPAPAFACLAKEEKEDASHGLSRGWPAARGLGRFLHNDLPAVFPDIEKQLAADADALRAWEGLRKQNPASAASSGDVDPFQK